MRRISSRLLGSLAVVGLSLAWLGWSVTAVVGSPQAAGRLAGSVLASPATAGEASAQLGWYLDGLSAFGVDPAVLDGITRQVASDPELSGAVAASAEEAWRDVLDGDGSAQVAVPGAELTASVREAVASAGLDPGAVPELGTQLVPVPVPGAIASTLGWSQRWPLALVAGAALGCCSVLADRERRRAGARLSAKVVFTAVAVLVGLWAWGRFATVLPGGFAVAAVASSVRGAVRWPVQVAAVAAAVSWAVFRFATPAVIGGRVRQGRPVPAREVVDAARR